MKKYSYATYTLAKSLKKKLNNYFPNRRKNNSILLKTLKSEVAIAQRQAVLCFETPKLSHLKRFIKINT